MEPRNETESFQTNSSTKKKHLMYAFCGTESCQKVNFTPNPQELKVWFKQSVDG